MVNFLVDMMMGLFSAAMLIWLMQIWRIDRQFSKLERIRAITFALAFLFGVFWLGIASNPVGAVICLMGLVISEFAAAAVFYEKYKGLEIRNE